jgi:hypothetical protein
MTDHATAAGETPESEPIQDEVAGFLAELEASALALDAALHFDERASVKPAYDRLMRIAGAYRELPARLRNASAACARPQAAGAAGETAADVDAIFAVLGEMSAGVEHYHRLAGALAQRRSRLRATIARSAQ